MSHFLGIADVLRERVDIDDDEVTHACVTDSLTLLETVINAINHISHDL